MTLSLNESLEHLQTGDLAPLAQHRDSSELAERLAQQRAQAAQFRRHYDEQLAALEQSWAERLEELDQQVRRRAEADYQFAADELARQRRRLKKKEARLEAEADRVELRRTRTRLQRQRLATYFRLQKRQWSATGRTDDDRHKALAAERDSLAAQLAEASQQLEALRAVVIETPEPTESEVDELRARLERALNDVRDLKRRNTELEQRSLPAVAKSALSQGLDWESQKQRMLAALEADEGDTAPAHVQERLTIDGTIRITDSVVQEKDREIHELKQRLEQQSTTPMLLPSVAAMAEIFDRDEGIRNERARLKELEEQWQQKLRQAEINLSMERAKHARQQAELEELRRFKLKQHEEPAEADDQPGEQKPPIRGRWLARLGLKEDDAA